MAEPVDKELYERIKQMANKVFKSPTGIYRSAYISKMYVNAGGEYTSKKKNSKFDKWISEVWLDLNNPIKQGNKIIGYHKCGSKNTQNNLYPLCRPSVRIDKDTPMIYQDIDKETIKKVNKQKQIIKNKGNIRF
jgi:hypothetical protein